MTHEVYPCIETLDYFLFSMELYTYTYIYVYTVYVRHNQI